jgi:hypothetical protein
MKYAISFLGGTSFATLAVVLGGGRSSAMIGLGVILTLAVTSGVLWLIGVPRLIELLSRFEGDAPVARKRSPKSNEQSTGYKRPSAKREAESAMEAVEEYREKMNERQAARNAQRAPVSAAAAKVLSDPELFGGSVN